MQAWVSYSGGRTSACDPRGDRCGEQRGPDQKHNNNNYDSEHVTQHAQEQTAGDRDDDRQPGRVGGARGGAGNRQTCVAEGRLKIELEDRGETGSGAIQVEGDAKLEFSRDGNRCCMKCFDADVKKPLASVSAIVDDGSKQRRDWSARIVHEPDRRMRRSARIVWSCGDEGNRREHWPEDFDEPEEGRVCGEGGTSWTTTVNTKDLTIARHRRRSSGAGTQCTNIT